MITFKQMEALFWLSRLGRFDRAAIKLNITQSTMSKRIQELERAVGYSVIDRNFREVRLTSRGEHLVTIGKDLIALQEQAMSLGKGADPPTRRLRFGVTELSAFTWLPRMAILMRDKYPFVNFEVEVDVTRNLYEKLQDRTIDLIVTPEVFQSPDITSIPLAEVEFMWVATGQLLEGRRRLNLEELSRYPLLMQGRRSGSGLLIDRWMREHGITHSRQLHCDSLVAIIGLAVAGVGVGYLPRQCFSPLLRGKKVVRVETDIIMPHIKYTAMLQADQPGQFLRDIIQDIRTVCNFSRQLQ